MRVILPSETALVLGGGGAKGAYEIGAIEALESLGIRASSVYGTSVGALNAAMYAQGRMDHAAALWEQLRLEDVVTEESAELVEDIEKLFDHPDKLLDFIARRGPKKSLDITPFAAMLSAYVDEDRLRGSDIRFGLVATRFPSLSCVEKRLQDMAPGSVHSWLLASSACYPAFPAVTIDDDRFIDGGFCDNVPVGMAIRGGAKRIIAIDIGRSRAHDQYDRRPNITYIRTSHPLGSLLDFDPERSSRNRILGRNDTLRAFGRLRGVRYSFDPHSVQAHLLEAETFLARLTLCESLLTPPGALRRNADAAPLFSILEETLPPKPDAADYMLRALELCAETAQLNPAEVYTIESLTDALRAHLPLEKADSMIDSLLGGRIGVLFAPPQPDRRLVIACLFRLLERERSFSPLALRTLTAFPREMLCALTLREFL
ncbi:MAG: patatin-like phospholipase family protein [Clostridia bacterium]|nr:patatin-like phospholipase family protein [Clostridia bacterium]